MLPQRPPINNIKSLDQCFGCGKDNPIGLKLNFTWDGETARAEFTPGELHQGWQGIAHGGILYTLLDEAMAYVSYFQGLDCVIARCQARFKRVALINETLLISATTTRKTRKLIETKASLTTKNGITIAEGNSLMYIVDQKPTPLAVIWDMDGVIANTAPFHFEAWRDAFGKRGISFTENDFRHNFGLRNDTIIRNILGKEISAVEIESISQEKETSFRSKLESNLKPLPGVISLMKELRKAKFRMALASSAPRENIDLLCHILRIREYFESIVSGKEVTEGKPSPQIFLLAAQRLSVLPQNCVVIEDAIGGIEAAKAAGMKCLAVTNTHPRKSLNQADLVVDSLEKIDINTIEKLLGQSTTNKRERK